VTPTDALWYLGRGTGIVALVLFTLTVLLGITTRSGRSALGIGRFGVAELHKTASLTGVSLILVHVVTLLLDPWAQLRLVDLLLPFMAGFRPLWQGLGTLAVDLLAILVLSSLLRHRIGPRLFHAVHWTAYAMWPLAMLHALGTGTDAATPWFRGLAVACGALVFLALGWRTSMTFQERGTRRIPRVVSR
jgi:sulfoxide reductase heme-binding subunit YedZ